MQITKVELKNIKNHAEAEFVFQPGVVAICGPNGSGKTTILEAIAWALFDHLDYKREDFVKRGAKRGQVAVGFISDLDQREYLVTRDTGGGYFVYDPVTKMRLIEQKNQVLPWLRQQIGVDPGADLAALFKTTIGVPQGTFTYDFTLAPSNRKSVFDQILKVEEYRKASENLRDTLRYIEGRITEAERRLAAAEGELKIYEETLRESSAVEERLKTLESDLETAQAERERLSRLVEQLNELQRKIETERSLLERLRLKRSLTDGLLSTAREAAEHALAAAKIVESAQRGHDRYLEAIARLAELERQRERRDELRERLAAVERELIEARSQAMRSRERLAEIAQARADLAPLAEQVERQQAIEQQLAVLREGRGELQSLKRSSETLDRELEKLRQRYSGLARQIEAADAQRQKAARTESIEAERSQLDDEIAQKELALANYRFKNEHLEMLRKERTRLSTDLEGKRAQIESLGLLAATAERLAADELRLQQDAEALARLRAEVARDEEMIAALQSGGLCPLLSEKCLNLRPGESLDDRFRSGLESRRREIELQDGALIKLREEVKLSAAATADRKRLPQLQDEAARLAQELEAQKPQLATLEAEISPGARVGESDIQNLKRRRSELEKEYREAREAERSVSQAEVMRGELGEVLKEGEEKKRARDEINQRLASLGDIEAQLAEAEAALKALADPRTRAHALSQ
ncbi:MAG TPA: SMC family ATPase, partial [Blastocatellia bacterium]|nr:SMC family ATPase [Blastocatellia bacterium]